jgi:fluoride exporter
MSYSWILVFVGGGIGSVARFVLSRNEYYQPILSWTTPNFPFGTIIVNIVSSFILGMLMGLKSQGKIETNVLLFLATGFCGGFSTFSTFAWETFSLLPQNPEHAFLNVIFNTFFCLLVIYLGFKIFS